MKNNLSDIKIINKVDYEGKLNNHEDYLRMLKILEPRCKFIGITSDNEITRKFKKDIICTEKTNTWWGIETSYKEDIYYIKASCELFDHLRKYETFCKTIQSIHGDIVEETDFGSDDIAFFDKDNNILLRTNTHEGFIIVTKEIDRLFSKNIFIIHGSFANPDMDWYPWLKEELIKEGYNVIVPTFPIGLNIQNYEVWKKELDKYKEYINEKTIFIAHSIGPIFIVKYIMENNLLIDSLYSISGFNGLINLKDFDKVNSTFFMDDYSNFDEYCKNRIAFYSNNDPFVPSNLLEEFSNKIKAETKIIENAGHFIEDDGYKEFPILLNEINKRNSEECNLRSLWYNIFKG